MNNVKNFEQFLNENQEVKKEYVIADMTGITRHPFYNNVVRSFCDQLPFATFFKTLERAEKILKPLQRKHPDRELRILNVKDVYDFFDLSGYRKKNSK